MGKVLQLWDGLRNVVSGLGGRQDKTIHSGYSLTLTPQAEIDACYRGTWLGRKIHDIPGKDMTREWRAWQADDDQIAAIEAEERRLQLQIKVRRALILARLYGGSAIIMGLPGDPTTPAPETIQRGALRYLHVVHRHQLTLGDPITDLEADGFGTPSRYELNASAGASVQVHPSRVIPFVSQEVPIGAQDATGQAWFWGDPLLQSIADALKSSDTAQATVTALLHEAKVDVIHIPGLMDHLSSSEYETRLIERLQIAAMIKSINNTLVLDGGDGQEGSGEKWETRQIKWEGLPDIQRTFLQLVSGAADIPATRLIGQSPDGMNATGDSDIRNYYDMLASAQKGELSPALAPLDERLIMSATGSRDEDIHHLWNPLWQMAPSEKAARDKTVAETVAVYAGLGVIPADAMEVATQNLLVEHSVFPGLEAALEDSAMEAEILAGAEGQEGQELEPNGTPQPANDPGAPGELQQTRQRRVGGGRGSAILRAANDRRRILADRQARRLSDAEPRPLYVSRKVQNGAEIVAWARRQGIKNILAAEDMHVTIAASRDPVDWMKADDTFRRSDDGQVVIPEGGARLVEKLGKAVVVLFSSWELSYRHGAIREAGASWDFAEYQPHVSISYAEQGDDFDLDAVEPYIGRIVLGPELFEAFNDDPPVAEG